MPNCSLLAAALIALSIAPPLFAGAAPEGTLPAGPDKRPLNLDFEDGTLRDWTATGDAFKGQPVRGPIDQHRPFGDGKIARQQGDYWIGGYELYGDGPTGTLTSAPFQVTMPWCGFLLGGGSSHQSRVELVRSDTGEVFHTASGHDSETMHRVFVDLHTLQGKQIFIRLVDESSAGWGHINFDDFRFYLAKPEIPKEAITAVDPAELPSDEFKFAGLPPEQAAKEMTLQPGFKATLFAGEPDVKQPIAFAMDDRGRIWVAEAYCYPQRQPEGQGKDRILVFEDTNGDGKFDKRTVFMECLNLVSGLEVGFGGVWVGAAPYLMYIPVQDGDEPKPAGKPQILLDGWGYGDTHETLNTFTWGPDGWLYGCHGVFTQSNVGKPGAPDSERTRINAGIWRYHPLKHRFELFAEGTSNPWGIDFNETGQCIIEACVIPHLWHMIQGGHFQRQAGEHFNPYVYDDIKTIADHVHWAGAGGPHAGNGRSSSTGGGHAHAGLMVYLGASWPAEYKGQAFMNNIHGARINEDTLEAKGSGFIGHHAPDFIFFNDLWSQIINLQYDQDGSLYMIDWYDKNQCHNANPDAHDRTNGRIFKVVYNNQKTTPVDLKKLSGAELVKLQLKPNDWWVRHARRLLEERGSNPEAAESLRKILAENPDPTRKLRALWALHAMGNLSEPIALEALHDPDPTVRAWTIQCACEDNAPTGKELAEFARLAKDDSSPIVRLHLASAAVRVAPEARWSIVSALHGHGEDAVDHNLPLMDWYALESLASSDFRGVLRIAIDSKLPRILEFTARRLAAMGKDEPMDALAEALPTLDAPRQIAMLQGIKDSLKGQRTARAPKGWDAAAEQMERAGNPDVLALDRSLSLTFGSLQALASARTTLSDAAASTPERLHALESLLGVKDPQLPPVLLKFLADPALRIASIHALAAYDEPLTPHTLISLYPSLTTAEKHDALGTLASRASFARPLLAALAAGKLPVAGVSADIARQIRQLNQADITQELEKVWGTSRESAADKVQTAAKYKAIVLAKNPPADPARGRAVFMRTCGQCHALFDAGGKIGPELTGSNRADLDYLLHNIVDPNAEIPNQYRLATVELKDGRVLAGIANQQDPKAVTVTSPADAVTVPRDEIKSINVSEISMMPEGILTGLTDAEVRDLISYLQSPAQVPMPAAQAGK